MAPIKEVLPEEQKYLGALREQVEKAGGDRSETGRITCASLRGQERMQNLFVSVGDAIQEGLLKKHSYKNPIEYDGRYKDQPVKIAIEKYLIKNRDNIQSTMTDNGLEIMITDSETGAVLSNMDLTTPRNDQRAKLGMEDRQSWEAHSIDYPQGWKRGDSGGDRPMTKQNDVMKEDGLEGFEKRNGMSPDLHAVMETMDSLVHALTPFKETSTN